MHEIKIHQQIHGYKNGHQLLGSSIRLEREDQDLIDRLSDISGALRPGEIFKPYVTGYPLPRGEYFVLAKTWQDFGAPRAGCVLTRSFLVPISTWADAVDVAGFIDLIQPVEHGAISVEPLTLPDFPRRNIERRIPENFNSAELVEALFLEKRQSVVLFECAASEAVLASLLNSFWPALRSKVAFCEMALAPRRVQGREFDILFAPNHVRARFSEWQGRRIEAERTNQESRHKWTQLLQVRIFSSGVKCLIEYDEIGVLANDAYGDESLLRLSMMWGELVEKADASPMAVLGLLDILNSVPSENVQSYARVYALAISAIGRALREMKPLELMQYFNAFLIKSSKLPHRFGLIKRVVNGLGGVVSQYSDLAVEFFTVNNELKRITHPLIFLAVARGLLGCKEYACAPRVLAKLVPETALNIILSSRLLCRQLISDAQMVGREANASYLAALVEEAPDEIRSRARFKFLRYIRGRELRDFLGALLVGATSPEILSAVRVVFENTRFEYAEYDEVFFEAASSAQDITGLRGEVARLSASRNSDRFLGATLSLSRLDIDWLIDTRNISAKRACRILAMKLGVMGDGVLTSALNDSDICAQLVSILSIDLVESSSQLKRVLMSGRIAKSTIISAGVRLLAIDSEERDEKFDRFILSTALRESGGAEDGFVMDAFAAVSPRVSSQQLILMAIAPNAGVASVARNLILLNSAQDSVRRGILMQVDDVSDRVAYRRVENLGSGALEAWACLIRDAYEVNSQAQIRAAKVVLEYAYKRKATPVHSLVVAAFPIVYGQIGEDGWRSSLSSIIQLVDLDERGEVVADLIAAFMASKWPPSELLHAAFAAGAVERLVRKLKHVRGGRRYLDEIKKDLKRMPRGLSERLRRAMSEAG